MKRFLLFAVVGLGGIPLMGKAAIIATTGPDQVNNQQNGSAHSGAAVGDTFSVPAGTFSTYVATNPSDPQISGDLNMYGYDLFGTVASVSGNVVTYTGTYDIFYKAVSGNTFQSGDPSVSSGTASLTTTFLSGNTATFNGTLKQTAGPSDPHFADFGALYDHFNFSGLYAGNLLDGGATGTLTGTLESVAAAPLPSAAWGGLALLGGMAVTGVTRKRRRLA